MATRDELIIREIRRFFESPERHVAENDRIWGPGEWILCLRPLCESPDGKPTFHHKDAHP
jgi:hypothetical protein